MNDIKNFKFCKNCHEILYKCIYCEDFYHEYNIKKNKIGRLCERCFILYFSDKI